MPSHESPAALQAVDELQAQATSPEDKAYLAQEKEKIEAERRDALVGLKPRVYADVSGHAIPREDVDSMIARGEVPMKGPRKSQ